jgi:toxin FitB
VSYLLDTNVISEIRKPSPNEGVAAWFSDTESSELYLSVLVIGEIRQGIERLRRRRDRRQASLFDRWLTVLKEEFTDRLIPVSVAIAECWGSLNARQPLPVIDGLLAATAIEHDLTFVTRETSRLRTTGARVLNPWRGGD